MPRLARRFSVVAVDRRGVGGSAAPATGYDAACMATDVAELIDGLAVGPVHVVGHDIGGWVAYALARLRPELVRTTVIMETLLPGIARLHAAFAMYRAIPENAAFTNAHRTPVGVPLLLVGGAQVFGPGMPPLRSSCAPTTAGPTPRR